MKRLVKFICVFSLLALGAMLPTAKAQLHVNASGDVGIGTTTPAGKLEVETGSNYRTAYLYNTYSGATSKYGLYNYLSNAGTGSRYGLYNVIYSNTSSSAHYGLLNYNYIYSVNSGYGQYNYTYCYDGDGARYGIYNYLACGSSCGTGSKYALYSQIGSCTGGYAGYFNGDVYVAGTLTTTSDETKKSNISTLSGALGLISQLKPKTYNYKADADLTLPTEKQYGFLAQDLQQVLPELVKDVETIGQTAPNKEGETEPVVTGEIKTVNYIALIPILVQGMQEQQKTIEQQQQRIAELEAKINR
ncbi:MAG TPA: tail fiber domain-containing protein [Bacteroidia bacterium]|nr:tail fiber domain-containing protein [Bacteroidia bacterium]